MKLRFVVNGKTSPALERLADKMARMNVVQADKLLDELRRRFREGGMTFEVKP